MAFRLMQSLHTMVVLLVVVAATMLVMEPHLAAAAPGMDGHIGSGRRYGGNSEEHRYTSSSATGNGDIHNAGVSSDGGSKHVGGDIQVGSSNQGRISNSVPNSSNPGGNPDDPSGNKGGKEGRNTSIKQNENHTDSRSNHSSSGKDSAGNGGHITPVRGNLHDGSNETKGHHQGPNIYPRLGRNRRDQAHLGARNRGNRDGNRNSTAGHTISERRNGGRNRRINHRGLNSTRGHGTHQTPIGGNGGSHTGGIKSPGASSSNSSNVGNPGDKNQGNNQGANSPSGNATEPDCKKKGGVCGDPKVVGGDGVVYYFYGRKNHDYCLLSDTDLHINAHFIGTRPPGRNHDNTWVQALGFIFHSHTLTIAATKNVSQWHNQVDHIEITYNNAPLNLTTSWASASVTLTRITTNSVRISIKGKMEVSLTVVPVSTKTNLVHKYGIPENVDCFPHLDMQFEFYNLSSSVNGFLGQTYHRGIVNRSVPIPIVGGASEKFESSSLLATNCKVSQYVSTASAVPVESSSNFHTVCGSSLPSKFPGITCHMY